MVLFLWGIGPPLTKLITADPWAAVTIRFGLAAVVLVGSAQLTGRRPFSSRSVWIVPAAAMWAVNNATFFVAIHETSIAVVSVIFALQPAIVFLVSRLFFRESIELWQLAWTVLAIVGTALVVGATPSEIDLQVSGLVLAVISTIALSLYHMMSRAARKDSMIHPVEWMTSVTIVAWLCLLPAAAVLTRPSDYLNLSVQDLALIATIGIAVGVIGHTLMSWIHSEIAANRSSAYLLLYNVIAVGLGWAINDEALTFPQMAGIGVVVTAAGAIAARAPEIRRS